MKKLTRKGTWFYDCTTEKPVYLVKVDFDYWYEIGKAGGQLEEDEKEELNEEGFLYHACFRCNPIKEPVWIDSPGYKTEKEAMDWAQSKSPSPINWNPKADPVASGQRR